MRFFTGVFGLIKCEICGTEYKFQPQNCEQRNMCSLCRAKFIGVYK